MSKQTLTGYEDDNEKNIVIILISTYLEDYKLGYTLNKFCGTQYKSVPLSLTLKSIQSTHSINAYVSPDFAHSHKSYLVQNQLIIKSETRILESLFDEFEGQKISLLKSHAKWSFFLLMHSVDALNLLETLPVIKPISAFQLIDLQALSNAEQNIIYTIYNEDQC